MEFNNTKHPDTIDRYIRLRDIVGAVIQGETAVQFEPMGNANSILFQGVLEKYEYHLDLLKKAIIVASSRTGAALR